MAFTVTDEGSDQNSYTNQRTIASFTPAANALMILTLDRNNDAAPDTIVGHGTWAIFNDGSDTADIIANGRTTQYGLLTGSSPSASTVVVDWPSSTNSEINIQTIEGCDVSGDINDAVLQVNSASNYNGSPGPFVNTRALSAFASATNMAMIVGEDTSSGEAGYSTAFAGAQIDFYFKTSEDTTPSYNSTATFTTTRGISLEVAEDAGVASVLTGTMIDTVDEDDITTGGKTIIITLTGDTFKAAGTGPIGSTADTQELIDGFDAASSPTNGWNNEVRDKAAPTEVVRTSSTVATWTVVAQAGYDISAQETITGTIPTAVLVTGAGAITSTPTFTIDEVTTGRIMGSLAGKGGLAGPGGLAGRSGGMAG